ncbi:DMT family transporter [Streptomyces flaveolus]|uniref:DMT family transporter n=1 Tax=Streptomyces flaveolus TaxID=67297 RepID=UPI0033B018E5
MSALALSVLLSVVSALAYAGGAIVQEQVAVSSPDSGYLPLRRPGWWGALALNGLGGLLHVVALAYGPLSLVQPLGALTIVFALPMAALCVGRRAGATAWRGALMATVGLAGLLSLVGSSSAHSLTPAQRLAVALVTGGAVVALMSAGLAAQRHPAVRSVLLATASGIAFGMSSVFTKTVAVDWSQGIALGGLLSLAVIGLFAVAGVLLSQASYRGGGLAAPLATLTVVNPVLAAAVGILMFGETFRHGTAGTVLALGCGVVAAGGLIMLTTERLTRETAPATARPGSAEVTPAAPPPVEASTTQGTPAGAVARLPMPRQRAGTGTDQGGPAETGPAAGGPARSTGPGALVDSTGAGEPVVRVEPIEPVVQAESMERVPHAGTNEPVPRAEPIEPVLHAGPIGRVVLTGPAEPAMRDGADEPVLCADADEPVLPGLLVSGAAGSGEAGADGAALPADGVFPASYTPLPAGVAVPLPVRARHRIRVRF